MLLKDYVEGLTKLLNDDPEYEDLGEALEITWEVIE